MLVSDFESVTRQLELLGIFKVTQEIDTGSFNMNLNGMLLIPHGGGLMTTLEAVTVVLNLMQDRKLN